MYLRVKGKGFTENIFREIAALTNAAKLHIREVAYIKEEKLVILPIDRFGITKAKKWFRSLPYRMDRGKRIRSTITIRNVSGCEIEDNCPEYSSEISMIFGLTIKDNRIFAASAEEGVGEEIGKAWYAIDIEVTEIDIGIQDSFETEAHDSFRA